MTAPRPERADGQVRLHGPTPFHRRDWAGKIVSVDGASTEDFGDDDLAEVVASGESDDDWDGTSAGIVRLEDGRFVCWSTWWGPTGDGFCCDAYGGDETIFVASTLDACVRLGLDEEGRKLCGLALPVDAP